MDKKQGDKDNDLSMFLGAGCFIVILLVIGFGIFGFIGALIEGSDNEEYNNNPYTEDFDGDGIGGDKDDHDYYHKNVK
ncbi:MULTISPECIES: hypothetical protein [Bacillus]|uniref:hypothetical protein n=1 Tax=Bacillus TaxID=1386 RepID=UPI0004683688|nr:MULTISPECIES: hypothetical protein [Bacillus]